VVATESANVAGKILKHVTLPPDGVYVGRDLPVHIVPNVCNFKGPYGVDNFLFSVQRWQMGTRMPVRL